MVEFKNTYQDLEVWKISRILVKMIYHISNEFPENEEFGLTNQMRRASISIISNIAEGHGRQYKKETIQFLMISKASLNELETQLLIAYDLEFTILEKCTNVFENIILLRKKLFGYIKYLESSNSLK